MARMTNAQLTDENIRLRAECDRLETVVAELRRDCEKFANMAAASSPREADQHAGQESRVNVLTYPCTRSGYYAYVDERRAACKAARRPVSYKTWEQFAEAHYAHYEQDTSYRDAN